MIYNEHFRECQLADEAGIDDARSGLPLNERNRKRTRVPAWNDCMWAIYCRAYNDEMNRKVVA